VRSYLNNTRTVVVGLLWFCRRCSCCCCCCCCRRATRQPLAANSGGRRERKTRNRRNEKKLIIIIINDISVISRCRRFALFGYCLWSTHTGEKTRSAFVRVRTGCRACGKQRRGFGWWTISERPRPRPTGRCCAVRGGAVQRCGGVVCVDSLATPLYTNTRTTWVSGK